MDNTATRPKDAVSHTPTWLTRREKERSRREAIVRVPAEDKLQNAFRDLMRTKRASRRKSSGKVIDGHGMGLDRKATAVHRQTKAKEGLIRRRTEKQERLDTAT